MEYPTHALPSTNRVKQVLAFAGSLREGSLNRRLIDAASEFAPPGVVVTLDNRFANFPLFNEDLEQASAGGPNAVRALRRSVASADGLLIATPEYNGSIPGGLKNALEWLSRDDPETGRVLTRKPVAITGATSGIWGTRDAQRALREVLTATGAFVLPTPALYVREAKRRFDAAGRLTDDGIRARLVSLLAAFDEWIERLAPGGSDVHA